MANLLKHARQLRFERDYPTAHVSFVVARTMGGWEGDDPTAFLPPWSRVKPVKSVWYSTEVDASVRAALGLALVSQAALDTLADFGFDP